jgi:hypothetical protein
VDDLTLPGDDEQGIEEALVDYLGPARLALGHDVCVVLPGERGKPVCLWSGDVDEQIARRGDVVPVGRPSQSRSVIAATEPTAGAVGHSLTASCMHTASDVFVILKAGGPTRVARHERALSLIVDPCPDK